MSNATKEISTAASGTAKPELKAKCENEAILHIYKLCVKDEEF